MLVSNSEGDWYAVCYLCRQTVSHLIAEINTSVVWNVFSSLLFMILIE